MARAADRIAGKYDVDVIFIAPYADIRRVAENTERVFVFAPYMDTLRPGRGMASVLPESMKAAGAQGVVLNHCERPMTLTDIRKTIERADELEMYTFVCADSVDEARAVACLGPDIINPEPSERIGKKGGNNIDFIKASVSAVHGINSRILVELAAGIRTGKEVYHNIIWGADGVGVSSGIMTAEDPAAVMDEMIGAVRRGREELRRQKREMTEPADGGGKQYESLQRIF